jgi:hypothetical protein
MLAVTSWANAEPAPYKRRAGGRNKRTSDSDREKNLSRLIARRMTVLLEGRL